MKVLMICLGNICRSPIAEGVFKDESEKLGKKIEVDSAGTSGFHSGEAPDSRAIKVMQRHGINIANQKSRQIQSSDFELFDVIFAMDRSNLKDLLGMCPKEEFRSKIKLFLGFQEDSSKQIVPDPYYGEEHDFERTFELCRKATEYHLKNFF